MGAMKAMARDFAGLLGIDAAKVASDNPDTLRDVVEDAKIWIVDNATEADTNDIRFVLNMMVILVRCEETARMERIDPIAEPYRLDLA